MTRVSPGGGSRAPRTRRATRGPWRMRQPWGRGARGRPWTAVGHQQRRTGRPGAPGRGSPPARPVLTGPPGPIHPAPGLAPSGGSGGGV